MKSFRYILAAIALLVLVIAMATPVVVTYTGVSKSPIELARKGHSDDPPWDPGDESASERDNYTQAVTFGPDDGYMLARKGDQPWDPGDESGRRGVGVRHV
jgi:hypothetical protein